MGETVGSFCGAPEMGVATDAVELASCSIVSGEAVTGGESIKAEIVRTVPFLEPTASRLESVTCRFCATCC